MPTAWKITSKKDGSQVELPIGILLEELMQKGMSTPKRDHEDLVQYFIKFLEDRGALSECNPKQLALLAFDLGYYYKVFLQKNNVEVLNDSQASGHG